MSSEKIYYKISEVAKMLRASRQTIYNMIYEGRLEAIILNQRGHLIPKSEVDKLIENSKITPINE